MVFDSIIDAIGNTPIVRLNKVASGTKANVFAKLEFTNPGGSIKDRIGWYMIGKARYIKTGWNDYRGHQRQYWRRPGDCRGDQGLSMHFYHAGQDVRGEDQKSARLRSPRDHNPDRG